MLWLCGKAFIKPNYLGRALHNDNNLDVSWKKTILYWSWCSTCATLKINILERNNSKTRKHFRLRFFFGVHETRSKIHPSNFDFKLQRLSHTCLNSLILFFRESAAGVNRVSYFFAVNFAQLPIIILMPLIYLSLQYTLTSPRCKITNTLVDVTGPG